MEQSHIVLLGSRAKRFSEKLQVKLAKLRLIQQLVQERISVRLELKLELQPKIKEKLNHQEVNQQEVNQVITEKQGCLGEEVSVDLLSHIRSRQKSRRQKNEQVIGKAFYRFFVIQIAVSMGVVVACWGDRHGWGGNDPVVPYGHFITMVILFVFVTWLNIRDKSVWYYYSITEVGLNEYRFFHCYIRTIPWEQIAQVGIQKDSVRDLGLIVTLKNAPKWDATKKKGSKDYWFRNRPSVLYIWYYRKALPVFEKKYGKIDY